MSDLEGRISKQRLLWMCRRGLLELDIVLQKIVANHYDQLSDNELVTFASILKETDNDLLAIFMQQTAIPTSWDASKHALLQKII